MPFKKGQSGNPLGKPKGAKNRSTIASEKIKAIIEGELDQIPEILAKLEDEKRLEMIIKLLPYVSARLSAQTVSLDAQIEIPNRPKWMSAGDKETAHLYD